MMQQKMYSKIKPISVQTNSGQMHLSSACHMGTAVLAYVARSVQMDLAAVISN